MRAFCRVDQLRGDPHPPCRFAHRTFEDIADAELAADLLHIDGLASVSKSRIAGDHEQPVNARQRSDDLLDNAVVPEVLRLMEQAITRDPHYGPALAWAALCCHRLLYDNRSEDRQTDLVKGMDFAKRALEVAGEDSGTLVNAAFALAYFGEDIDAMMTLVDRSLALNPSFARGWHLSVF
jgi:hypothetical protein